MPGARGGVGVGVAEGAVAGEGRRASLLPREPGLAHPRRIRWPLPRSLSPGPLCSYLEGGGVLGPAAPLQPQGLPLTPCPVTPSTPSPAVRELSSSAPLFSPWFRLGSMSPTSWATRLSLYPEGTAGWAPGSAPPWPCPRACCPFSAQDARPRVHVSTEQTASVRSPGRHSRRRCLPWAAGSG